MERVPPSLQLCFGQGVDAAARPRIEYAFRTFCAVYECDAIVDDSSGPEGAQRVFYGTPPRDASTETTLSRRYVPRSPLERAPAPVFVSLDPREPYLRLGITKFPVFHGNGQGVDWLGEIFEWISCADEYAVTERDDVGRVPLEAALHGRYDLDPTVPYVSVAMYELARALGINPPVSTTWIAASHDLDYLPTSAAGNVQRVAKNVAIAALVERDSRLIGDIAFAALRGIVRRRSPVDCIDDMLARERALGITSTSNVICRRASPRDANYTLREPQVWQTLCKLDQVGELGVHASYTSLEDGALGDEVEALRAQGFDVSGVRAHWLRYAGDNLFEEVLRLGLSYDSSVGFVGRTGFRSGASFVYRPYRFAAEEPYSFFEVPLAIMDGALYTHARQTHTSPHSLCERVLDMTDAFPAGGISVLWHNAAFEGAQLPRNIGQLYWKLPRSHQRWRTSGEVVAERRVSFDRTFGGAAVVR
jgi:hypothetical protein